MRWFHSMVVGASCLCMALATLGDAGEGKKSVKASQKFSGKVADPKLGKHAPKSGVVPDQKSLEGMWTAWTVKGDVPKIDFNKDLVLVHMAGGPNIPTASYTLEKGDLKAKVLSTLIGGPGFGYSIEVLPREGVKTYQGKPLE